MAKYKAEKIRSNWFSSTLADRRHDYAKVMEQATRDLSTRSRNVMNTVVGSAEDFNEIFGSISGLRNKLLSIRNLGMRSVVELESWWENVDEATRSALLGKTESNILAQPRLAREGGARDAADWIAMRLALTFNTLSVRSQNVLRSMLPDQRAYREQLVLNPNLEQDLYSMRNLGRKSVQEICEWVEHTRRELDHTTHGLAFQESRDAEGTSWTKLSPTALQALQEVLGEARLAALPPKPDYIATPNSARNVQLSDLLDALIFRPLKNDLVSVKADPYVQEMVAWLEKAPGESLTPIRLQGIWFQLIQWLQRTPVPIGRRLAQRKALRHHLVWWDVVLHASSLEAVSKEFGITRERTRQIKMDTDGRIERVQENALLEDLLVEESGQIWVMTKESWHPLGPTDSLLWAGLAVRQGAAHEGRVWLGRRPKEQLVRKLNDLIERTGVKEDAALLQEVGAFFDGCVAPRPVLDAVKDLLTSGLRPNALLRRQVLALLQVAGKALSLDQIQARLIPSPDRSRLHSQILRLSRSGALISIGKRGFYKLPIPGFNGTSYQYDDAAQMYLAAHPKHCACVEEILDHYVMVTGLETSHHSFHASLQIQAEKPDSPLVLLPFYHIGLKSETADLQRRAANANAPLITANLNHLRGPIPEPGTVAADRLIQRFATKFRQDPEFIAMAITHRHWTKSNRT